MITKYEFNKLIQSPKKQIFNLNLSEINKLKTLFPYCEIIYNISLLRSHLLSDINFRKNLALTALYSSNRKHLFKLIHPIIKTNPIKRKNITRNLFEDWLKQDSLSKTNHTVNKKELEKNIKHSVEDNDYLTTETLANIYLEQGHYKRAIQAYEILCLKYPKKSGLFANQIKKIKTKIK